MSYALLGFPIESSPSPAMHNAGFAALGLNENYALRPCPQTALQSFRAEFLAGSWQGFNVTTPLKTEVAKWPELTLSPRAKRISAVNTVYQKQGRWHADISDVDGVFQPLQNRSFNGDRALILGAGGAARAGILALEKLGLRISIAARRKEAAENCLSFVCPERRGQAASLGSPEASVLFEEADVVLQCTPLGRKGESHTFSQASFRAEASYFEMLYYPRRTPFLEAAQAVGARTIEGHEMLLYQGATSFELWTQRSAPMDAMRLAIVDHLGALF